MSGFRFGSGKSFGFAASKGLDPEPDPLAGVEYTGDAATDSLTEFDALQNAYRARSKQERKRFQQATDSEFWVALCFRDRDAKEAFIAAVGAAMLGDKYVDGHAFARQLGIEMEES